MGLHQSSVRAGLQHVLDAVRGTHFGTRPIHKLPCVCAKSKNAVVKHYIYIYITHTKYYIVTLIRNTILKH